MKKRSITNLRFEFQPEIMIEAPVNHNEDETASEKNPRNKVHPNSPKENYLNINTGNYKKQKTLSAQREKQGSKKPIDKSSIKKSNTRTSKWSQYMKSTQKGGNKSPNRSKTIERKFTMSSSISSIK